MSLDAWIFPGKRGKTSGKGVLQAAHPAPPSFQAGGGSVQSGIEERCEKAETLAAALGQPVEVNALPSGSRLR